MFGRTAPSQLPPRPSLGGVIDPPRANANAASSARSRSHACQLGLEASAIGKRRRRLRELPCFVRRSPFQASFPPMPEPLLRVHPLFRDHNSRSRRIQPKTAFSRFPPVHRAALKGQFRVDSGPIARQRSLKPASALPPIGGWGITTNEQVRDVARSARPRSSPFTVSASGCLPRPVSGASGVAPSATERSQERLRSRNPESAPGLPLAHMNCIQKGALAQRLRASRMAASRSRPRTEALCVCTSCL